MKKAEIRHIVREILREKGLLDRPGDRPDVIRRSRPRSAPTVLTVFHAGVRKLEQALEQVRLIEEIAARSSVFTVRSARAWVCGQDVKDIAGSRCILDTVRPEGLEKALEKADILALPTFCFKTAAKVARLTGDDQETAIVLAALMRGKPVLAARDGFTLLETLRNPGILAEIERVLDKLKSYGMRFCNTDQLAAAFQQLVTDRFTAASEVPPALRLITAKEIQTAVDSHQDTIRLAPGGIVTPLARDQAREYSIRIEKLN